ncbi:Nodulin-like [Klebsormidium nitens]|uniref:Nodulin-like n=1 Tax=Klebsormidium nitens TaxID=105231 RepID=A0A1Y1IPA7_KLENI|nr:Nodulin-like [Klebsormidium nitens]|eukprot:GAQ89948.1 Nodulin-like [Klebsormidium nitens]
MTSSAPLKDQPSLLENEWVGLAAGIYAEACSGLSYCFAVYSEHLKETLNWSQTQIDGLGSSKDFGGGYGVPAGLLYNFYPPWVSVLIGASFNLAGYLGIWLTSLKLIAPPYWLVCAFMVIGSNGEPWVSTPVMVTNMQTFPTERGHVVGLLKAYLGLSAAMFARIYTSFFDGYASRFILLQAIGPFVVLTAVMAFVKPYPNKHDTEPHEIEKRIRWSYCIILILAGYLFITIVLSEVFVLGVATQRALTTIMIAILFLPLAMPFFGRPRYKHVSSDLDALNPDDEESSTLLQEEPVHTDKPVHLEMPELTLYESVQTANFWLFAAIIGAGTGSGLTIVNNFGQIARSFGTSRVSSFISLFSIWNCLGRLLAGYSSECIVRAGLPRPIAAVMFTSLMGLAILLLATGASYSLYVGSVLVGLAQGAHWALMPVLTSELFGLRNYGATFNTVTVASPISAYFLSTWLTGTLYDREAAAQHASQIDPPPGSEHTCHGAVCFQLALVLLSCVCAGGVICGLALVMRTRGLYRLRTKTSESEEY